jgi:competence protein ComGC
LLRDFFYQKKHQKPLLLLLLLVVVVVVVVVVVRLIPDLPSQSFHLFERRQNEGRQRNSNQLAFKK